MLVLVKSVAWTQMVGVQRNKEGKDERSLMSSGKPVYRGSEPPKYKYN